MVQSFSYLDPNEKFPGSRRLKVSKFLVIARQLLIFELRNRNNELNPQNSK